MPCPPWFTVALHCAALPVSLDAGRSVVVTRLFAKQFFSSDSLMTFLPRVQKLSHYSDKEPELAQNSVEIMVQLGLELRELRFWGPGFYL